MPDVIPFPAPRVCLAHPQVAFAKPAVTVLLARVPESQPCIGALACRIEAGDGPPVRRDPERAS